MTAPRAGVGGQAAAAALPVPQAPAGYERAGLLSRLTYHFVEPLIAAGVGGRIDERTSAQYLPSADHAETLATEFEAAYSAVQVGAGAGAGAGAAPLYGHTVFRLFMCACAWAVRFGAERWHWRCCVQEAGSLCVRHMITGCLQSAHRGLLMPCCAGRAPLGGPRLPALAHLLAALQVARGAAHAVDLCGSGSQVRGR